MPNVKYENQGVNTYLVYEIASDVQIDSMSLGMLTNNTIPGLAEAIFTQIDSEKYIKYNVSAKVSASQLFSGPVNKKRLLGVFTGILDAMISAEDYMLDTGSILLDMDYIFVDVSTCDTVLICLPVISDRQSNPDLGQFFKNIIFNTQFDQTENCDHVAQILNYLNSNPALSLAGFKTLLEDIAKPREAVRTVKVQPQVPPAASNAKQTPAVAVQSKPAVTQTAASQLTVPQSTVSQMQLPYQNKVQNVNEVTHLNQTMRPLTQTETKEEKQISLFYLLQHYNKENAAQYKAQKAAKKEQKDQPKALKEPKPQKKNQKKAEPKQANTAYAIPGHSGAQANAGFAIPGQPTPTPAPNPTPSAADKPKQVEQAHVAATAGKCPSCGAPTYPNQEFCASCGARLNAAPAYGQPQAQPTKRISFGETTVLNAKIGETTVLDALTAPQKAEPCLIRSRNNEKIPLNKPVFRIGKERSYVDYFIGDNTAVSRSHANIVNRDGTFFVVDTNSTNHTYVDGMMIQSNVETQLKHGTRIRLANEEFEFRMY